MEALEARGYAHYEISNFALPGWHSRHNSNYWQWGPYLGIGPSAHSFNGHSRQYNVAHNAKYLKGLDQQAVPFEKEILTRHDKINEFIMTGLRRSHGLDLGALKQLFDYELDAQNMAYLQEQENAGLLKVQDHKVCLTKGGKLWADSLAAALFVTL